MELVLSINNKNVTVNVPTDEMLLTTLRNLGYYSVRCGCDTTNCGLCTVWVDDEITLSCAYPTFRAQVIQLQLLKDWKKMRLC